MKGRKHQYLIIAEVYPTATGLPSAHKFAARVESKWGGPRIYFIEFFRTEKKANRWIKEVKPQVKKAVKQYFKQRKAA